MHMAMVCSDDPVKSADELKLDGAGRYATLHGQAVAATYAQFCSLINVKELPDSTDVDVTTDVPTLLLSGNLDVATPTFHSQEVADALPNATMVVFPGRTHVQIAGANLCAGEIMTQFVLEPTAKLDTSCVAEAPVVGFGLPDGTSSDLMPKFCNESLAISAAYARVSHRSRPERRDEICTAANPTSSC